MSRVRREFAEGILKKHLRYFFACLFALGLWAASGGKAFGLDPARMIEILNASSGRSNSTEYKFPGFILNQAYNSGFGIGLLAKDLRLARELMDCTGTPDTLLRACAGIWQQAAQHLGELADHTEVYKFLESISSDAKSQDT